MSIEVAVPNPARRTASAPAVRESARHVAAERAAEHLNRLYRLAVSLCGSGQLAEDLVQEAYARLFARPRRLRRGDEFPYLARIVRNLLHDHHRRRGRIEWSEVPPDDQLPAGDENDPETSARTRELYALVGTLPQGQRDAVAAVDVAGLTYREAARMLAVPIGTIMSRLARGRSLLARELGQPA